MCGKNITLCMSWEESEKVETQSTCCDQTLKIDAKRVSNNEDNTVTVMAVVGKFKIEKKELSGKDIMWLAVLADDSSFPFTTDDNRSWNAGSAMKSKGKKKRMEPKESAMKLKGKKMLEPKDSGKKLKRKYAEMKMKRSHESDWADDDYNIAIYNKTERDDYESLEEVDDELAAAEMYDPRDFLIDGPYDKDGYPREYAEEKVMNPYYSSSAYVDKKDEKKSKGDVDKKSKDDGSGVDVNKEGTGVVDLRIFIHPL